MKELRVKVNELTSEFAITEYEAIMIIKADDKKAQTDAIIEQLRQIDISLGGVL